MNAKTKEAIETHGRDLLAIFPNATEQDPIGLCKKLRRIENRAHRRAEDFCNGVIDSEEWERKSIYDLACVRKILGVSPFNPVSQALRVNGDPRGYALKISDEWMREEHDRRELAARDRVPPVSHGKWEPEDWKTWENSRKPLRLHRDMGGYGIIAPDLTA